MRRLLAALLLALLAWPTAARAEHALRLCGPPVVESLPLVAMAHQDSLPGTRLKTSFAPWRSPDQLRALVAGGQADVVLVTIATAAVLRARGLPCRVLAVMAPPVWLVSADPQLRQLADLAGREVLLPFGPGEMPALLLGSIARAQGVELTTRQAGSALEAVNLLAMGRASAALLSEPAATLALTKAAGLRGARALYKSLDLRQAWARAFPQSPLLATTALTVVGPRAKQPEICAPVASSFRSQCAWVAEHPRQALALAHSGFPSLATQMQNSGITGRDIHLLGDQDGKAASLFFLERLYESSPAATGGVRPDMSLWESGP